MASVLREMTLSKRVLTQGVALLCSASLVMAAVSGCSSSNAGAMNSQASGGVVSGTIARYDSSTGAGLHTDLGIDRSSDAPSSASAGGSDSLVGATTAANPGGVTGTAPAPVSNSTTALLTGASSSSSATVRKSIKNWASCNGVTDDNDALARALSAAKNAAFTLVIDCPLLIKIGQDIAKPIFIDSGTTVEFLAPVGKITVDNIYIPAFVMANSRDITLKDWNVEYNAALPVKAGVGYENKGQLYSGTSPGGAFSDQRMSAWLTANRGVKFDRSKGWVAARWPGPTNVCAIFYMTGSTQDVTVSGMKVYAPANVGGDRFIPTVYSTNTDWKSRQTVTSDTMADSNSLAVPSDLIFTDISLDGIYMGWVGIAKNVLVENVISNRYGDLQDSSGNNVGGVGKWFAPPHLFYWSLQFLTDKNLWSSNIQIKNVNDLGVRFGTARDKGGSDTVSGSAPSLKISCIDCVIDTYKSARPDGFIDVLTSTGLTVSNVTATFDTSFTNNLYYGFRWPATDYKSVTFENVSITDTAAVSYKQPIGPANMVGNDDIVLSNVQVTVNKWGGSGAITPSIAATSANINIAYTIGAGASRTTMLQRTPESVVITATPASIKAGESTTLNWTGREVNSCMGSGSFSGSLDVWNASKTLKLTKPGLYDYTVTCRDSSQSVASTVRVVVQ